MDTTTLSTVALIAAIATIAPLISEATDRKVPSVVLGRAGGAAMLSVLIFPYLAFALRRRHPVSEEPPVPAPPDEPDTVYEDEADV